MCWRQLLRESPNFGFHVWIWRVQASPNIAYMSEWKQPQKWSCSVNISSADMLRCWHPRGNLESLAQTEALSASVTGARTPCTLAVADLHFINTESRMLVKMVFEGQNPINHTNKLGHNKAPVIVYSCVSCGIILSIVWRNSKVANLQKWTLTTFLPFSCRYFSSAPQLPAPCLCVN